jgi:hypothetical protein
MSFGQDLGGVSSSRFHLSENDRLRTRASVLENRGTVQPAAASVSQPTFMPAVMTDARDTWL